MNTVTVTFDDPTYSVDQDYTFINGERFSGTLKILDSNATLEVETQYKDGMINGYDREYYNNGQMKQEAIIYIDSVGKTTSYKEWSEQGSLIYHEKTHFTDIYEYTKEIIVDNRP